MAAESTSPAFTIPTEALLEHWQGHRRVTRRLIQAFPEDQLFKFSVGEMRPFAANGTRDSMASAGIQGIATGKWATGRELMHHSGDPGLGKKEALRHLWDETTDLINSLWPRIPPGRFQEVDTAFGMYEGVIYGLLLYLDRQRDSSQGTRIRVLTCARHRAAGVLRQELTRARLAWTPNALPPLRRRNDRQAVGCSQFVVRGGRHLQRRTVLATSGNGLRGRETFVTPAGRGPFAHRGGFHGAEGSGIPWKKGRSRASAPSRFSIACVARPDGHEAWSSSSLASIPIGRDPCTPAIGSWRNSRRRQPAR